MKKTILTILSIFIISSVFGQRYIVGDTLIMNGGGSFENNIKLINSIRVDSILTTVINSDGALITSGAAYDLVADGFDSVNATNISSVIFYRADGSFVHESFGHVHTEYALQTQISIIEDSLAVHRIDINSMSGLWEIDGSETQLKTADAIDMQSEAIINIKNPTNGQDAATKNYVLQYTEVNLSSTDVNGLGTKFELIAAPGVGKFLQIISVSYYIDVSVQLDVGSQGLALGFYSGTQAVCSCTESDLETPTDLYLQLASEKVNAEFAPNDSFGCVLTSATDPSGGGATIDFYITYRVVVL